MAHIGTRSPAKTTVLYGTGIYDEVTETVAEVRALLARNGRDDPAGYITLTRAATSQPVLVKGGAS